MTALRYQAVFTKQPGLASRKQIQLLTPFNLRFSPATEGNESPNAE